MIFVFDGTGLGHLRRMSRIANELCKTNHVLFVTGMSQAAWFLDSRVVLTVLPNLLHLPGSVSFDAVNGPWPATSCKLAIDTRKMFLSSLAELWCPHAFLSDYLPFGRRNELGDFLDSQTCKKYFVLRGVVDTSDNHFLGGTPSFAPRGSSTICDQARPRSPTNTVTCPRSDLSAASTQVTSHPTFGGMTKNVGLEAEARRWARPPIEVRSSSEARVIPWCSSYLCGSSTARIRSSRESGEPYNTNVRCPSAANSRRRARTIRFTWAGTRGESQRPRLRGKGLSSGRRFDGSTSLTGGRRSNDRSRS
jgi:hypothetical protein